MPFTTGKGAAAASRGTAGGATGTTPTCGDDRVVDRIVVSRHDFSSLQYISSITSILRSVPFDDIRPRVAILSDHDWWHPHIIAAHANFLARLELR